MSEIFAPGSIAGPQGPAGPAGSQGSVTTLASSVLPKLGNLFDSSRVAIAMSVANDGTLVPVTYNSGGGVFLPDTQIHSTPLMYCAGATSIISNLPVSVGDPGAGGSHIVTYDANGDFIECLDSGYLAGVSVSGRIYPYTVWPLKGTQVYIRWPYREAWLGGLSEAAASVYVGTTAMPPSIPGAFQAFGYDTPTDVNAKDAAVLASANSAIAAAAAKIGSGLALFADEVLPNMGNRFDYTRVVPAVRFGIDGAVVPVTYDSGGGVLLPDTGVHSTPLMYCAGATAIITDLPVKIGIPGSAGDSHIATYDANGDFIECLDSDYLAAVNNANCRIAGYTVWPLKGNQTYIRWSYQEVWVGGYGWVSDPSASVYVGTTAAPPSIPASYRAFGFDTTGDVTAKGIAGYYSRVKYATALGADPTGSADSSAVLNAFLSTGSATNPIELVLDGMFGTTGLAVSAAGYTTIRGIGWGSGLKYLGGGKNVITIGTGAVSDGDTPTVGGYNLSLPPRTCTNVKLSNFTVDPNGSDSFTRHGVVFVNTTNITIENMNFKQASWFSSLYSNCAFIKVYGSQFITAGTLHDGLHFNGPCEDINIDSCYFSTGDDSIALNCPEGYSGDISRVAISNCVFNGSLSVMRIYTSSTDGTIVDGPHKARNIVVSNCTGYTYNLCFSLGVSGGGWSSMNDIDQIQDLSVSNCTLSSPHGLAYLLTPIGSISFRGVKFIPTSAEPVITAWGSPIGELLFDDFTILRNPDGHFAPATLVTAGSGATINRLTLNNVRVLDEDGTSYAAMPALLDVAAVTLLRLDAIDMAHVTSLGGLSGVTTLRGAGALEAGVQVSDAAMDNNTIYLSSNAGGAPSIKVGGTAKRLTLN